MSYGQQGESGFNGFTWAMELNCKVNELYRNAFECPVLTVLRYGGTKFGVALTRKTVIVRYCKQPAVSLRGSQGNQVGIRSDLVAKFDLLGEIQNAYNTGPEHF